MAEDVAPRLIELGAIVLGLAMLARLAGRLGIPSIPLYLLAGLAFGKGGIAPVVTSSGFIGAGAEIGLILLMFMLGLEHSASDLVGNVPRSARHGIVDAAFNFVPGFVCGLILGWSLLPSAFLGGMTYVSSSGIAARLLHDLREVSASTGSRIVSLLLIEDLAMAVYLPVMAALLGRTEGGFSAVLSVLIALAAVALLLGLALKVEVGLSRLLFSTSDETMLLTILGVALAVAGAAELIRLSAAVGALLLGVALSGPAARAAAGVLAPLRDLFAAIFFAFIGLGIDPRVIPDVLPIALLLAAITTVTKLGVGWHINRGAPRPQRLLGGTVLVPRGEFSLVIGGLAIAAGAGSEVGPLGVTYTMLLAVLGPLLAHGAASAARSSPDRQPTSEG